MNAFGTLRTAAPVLLAVTLVTRLPGLIWQILGSDDADFTVIARAIAHGATPYRDIVDIKPPLAFAAYLPNALFGSSLLPVQLEAVLVVVATAYALGLAAKRTWQSEAAGVCAAFLTIAAGMCEAPTVSTELLMNLPTALALAAFARAEVEDRRADEVLAGALIAVGSLIRHQAVFTLGVLGLAVILLGLRYRRPWFLRCVLLSVGFAMPWALTLAAFKGMGALDAFIEWVITRNVSYVGQSNGSALARFAQSFLVCIVAAAPVAWWMAITGARRGLSELKLPSTPERRLAATWGLLLLVSWVPVSLGGRFYEHYFLQLVPAVALLGAGPAAALLEKARAWSTAKRALLGLLVVGPALGSVGYATARGVLGEYPLQNARVRAIGEWAARATKPADRLFVWGHFSAIYLAADRLPATRYVTTSWHLGNFDPQHLDDSVDLRRFRSERDVRQTLEDLAAHPPAWIIDTTPADIHSWHRLPLSLVPDLEAAIDAGWAPIVEMPGGRGSSSGARRDAGILDGAPPKGGSPNPSSERSSRPTRVGSSSRRSRAGCASSRTTHCGSTRVDRRSSSPPRCSGSAWPWRPGPPCGSSTQAPCPTSAP